MLIENHMISDDGYRKLQFVFGNPRNVGVAEAIFRAWELTHRFKHRMSLDEWIGTLSDEDLMCMGSDMVIFRDEVTSYWAEMLDDPASEPVGKVDWLREGF